MSAIESTMRPSGSPKPRSATRNADPAVVLRRQPENRAHVERAQNFAAQIDEPRHAWRRAGDTPQMADARDLAELVEWNSVHLRAEIEAQIRNPFLFLAGLRITVALLFDCGKDGFRIHGRPYSLNSLIRVLN